MNKVLLSVAILLVVAGYFPTESASLLKTIGNRFKSVSGKNTIPSAADVFNSSNIPRIFDALEHYINRIGSNMRGNVNASFVNITANAKIGLVVLNGFSAVSDTAIKADFAGLITKLTAASNANTAALNSFSQDLENALYAINASIALESAEAKAENATENSDFNKLKRLIETVTKERMGDCLQATLLSEMKGFTKVSIMATNCLDNITTLSNNFFAADKAVGVAWNTSYTVAWNAISACIGNSTTSALINALSTTKKQALDKCLKAVNLALDISKSITALSPLIKSFGTVSATCLKTSMNTAYMTGKNLVSAKVACLEAVDNKKIG